MSKSIKKEISSLSSKSVTTYALHALDFVVPGEWENIVDFEDMVRKVTGETDQVQVQKIADRAAKIYKDPDTGYQQALWIYQTVDKADVALGAAALADKVGERISFLSFLNRLTPKADTTQTIDLGVKLVAELVAFCQINGVPTDRESIGQFTSALVDSYRGEALMRMVALVCLDGLVPLGPDFTQKVGSTLGSLSPSQLESNPMYKRIGEWIPGDGSSGQLGFINRSFESVQEWINNLLTSRDLTPEKVVSSLKQYISFTDDKLDYLAAFLDMTTDYYSHTGTQTVAHNLIERARNEG